MMNLWAMLLLGWIAPASAVDIALVTPDGSALPGTTVEVQVAISDGDDIPH